MTANTKAAFWRIAAFGMLAWFMPALMSTLAPAESEGAAPMTEAIVGRPVPPRLSQDFLRYCAEVEYYATEVVAPMTRTTTYYFSTSGSDANNGLTTGTPKQTIGALNTLIASSGGNTAFLLKCGDNFNASTVGINGHASADNCTLGSYGTGARPVVNGGTSTLASGGTLWTLGSGNRYSATVVAAIGDMWRRDDRTFLYKIVASTAECEATPYSIYPNGTTVHMNDGGADPDLRAFEYTQAATTDDSGVDIPAGCSGWRIDGVEFIGWGADGGSVNQEYGIKFSGNGSDKCVVTNCRATRSARHNIGLNGGANSGGWMFVGNCEAGMDTEAGAAPFVFYQQNGAHEVWLAANSTPWGAQPITAARTWADGMAVISHTNSDSTPPGFVCVLDHRIPANPQGFGCHQGVIVNNMAHITDPNRAEAVIIGTRMEKSLGTGSNGTTGHTVAIQGTLEIGGYYQFSLLDSPVDAMGSYNPRGFVYNTFYQFDCTNSGFTETWFGAWNPAASTNDPKFRHCFFEVLSNGTGDFGLNYDSNFAAATQTTVEYTLGAELSNSVFSVIRKYPTSTADIIRPALVNNASVLKNNAYWSVSADGTYAGVSNTVNAVTLTHAPIFGQTPAQGSPLAQTGAGGYIPYDFSRLARNVVQPTIGPAEMPTRLLIDPSAAEMALQLTQLDTSGLTTTGSLGKLLVDTGAAVDTEVAAILDDTGTSGVALAADSITASVIATDAIGSAEIASNAIDSAALAFDAITSSKIAADAIGASEIADNAIDAGAIAANAIGNSEIAASALTLDRFSGVFPSNFPSLGINASGHVSRVTLSDTITTYTGNTPQTGDTFTLANGANGFASLMTVNNALTTDVNQAIVDLAAIPTNAELATALDPLPTAVENAAAVIGSTAAGSAGTVGKILADYAAVKPATTIAAADDVEGGAGGTVVPVNQIPVPLARTWIPTPTDEGLVSETARSLKVGTSALFAVDFREDLPTNGRLASTESAAIVTGTEGGVTFPADLDDPEDAGVDKSQSKIRIAGVTAGTYVIEVEANHQPSDGGGTSTGRVVLNVIE